MYRLAGGTDFETNERKVDSMKRFEQKPTGVCATKMVFEIEGDRIHSIETVNGCEGSSRGICALARGMRVEEFIERCAGIDCKKKRTSCPDQMARILSRYQNGEFD